MYERLKAHKWAVFYLGKIIIKRKPKKTLLLTAFKIKIKFITWHSICVTI